MVFAGTGAIVANTVSGGEVTHVGIALTKEKGLLAVGATVALEALFAGPWTNAAMNPARSIGPAIANEAR